MKKARILPVPAGAAGGYAWKWQDCAGKPTSADTFELYFDCVSDARLNGYTVELTYAAGDNAPGGAEFKLREKNVGA